MLVIRLVNNRGNKLSGYDALFTAGPEYDENHLPPGFFVDRQRNSVNPGKLTYYVDYDVLNKGLKDGKFGIKIVVRPQSDFAYYTVAKYQGSLNELKKLIEPNQSLMIEIQMRQYMSDGVFGLTENLGPESFKKADPGKDISVALAPKEGRLTITACEP